MFKVYIDKPIPKTCAGCVLCNPDMICLAENSTYNKCYDERPVWCPIDLEESN